MRARVERIGLVRMGAALAVLAASLALSTGCGSGDDEDQATTTGGGGATEPVSFPNYDRLAPRDLEPTSEDVRVAILIPSLEIPAQSSIVAGAEEEAEELGIETEVFNAGGVENVPRQVSQFETAIGSDPDAIIVFAASPTALNSQVEAATGQGIEVVGMLVAPTSGALSFSLFSDFASSGRVVTENVVDAMGGEGNAYVILGAAGSALNTLFKQGVEEELERHPEVSVTFREDLTTFNAPDAQQTTENALTSEPDVDGVITNNLVMGQGALAALEQSGQDDVAIGGLGPDTSETFSDLRAGELSVGVGAPYFESGRLTMDWTLALVEGEEPRKPGLEVPPLVLTPESIQQAIDEEVVFQSLTPSTLGCGPGEEAEC